MLDQVNATPTPHKRLPWNKGKLTGTDFGGWLERGIGFPVSANQHWLFWIARMASGSLALSRTQLTLSLLPHRLGFAVKAGVQRIAKLPVVVLHMAPEAAAINVLRPEVESGGCIARHQSANRG